MHELFNWWWRQILAFVRLHAPRAGLDGAIVLALDPPDGDPAPGLVVTIRRRRRERLVGRVVGDRSGLAALHRLIAPRHRPRRVVLRLPPGMTLERTLELPLAAERGLDQAIGYEIDRLTPFIADEIYWACAVSGRAPAAGRLQARLWLVARAAIAPLLARLDEAGLAPALLEAALPGGASCRISLRRPDGPGARRGRQMRTLGLELCGALAVAVVALPFVRQSFARARVEARIAARGPRVALVERLRRAVSRGAAARAEIAAERARLGDALAILAAATRALPDDSFLTAFRLDQGKLSLDGQSTDSARLIGRLSADPRLRNAAFAAPVTRVIGAAGDLFAIHARVRG